MHSRTKDLTGQPFGRLTVTTFAGYHNKIAYWFCLCICGSPEKQYIAKNLMTGNTQSCGCLSNEVRGQHARARLRTHGMGKTHEYTVWYNMTRRCHNPKDKSYERYGARGITVCERWRHSFEAFLADMGKRPSPQHSLERLRNTEGYTPDNCIWATLARQARNRRSTRWITWNDATHCLTDWATILGMSYTALRQRLASGWTVEHAFTIPIHKRPDSLRLEA